MKRGRRSGLEPRPFPSSASLLSSTSKTKNSPKTPPPPPPNLTSPASELRFRFELRKNVTATLSLHNPGSDRVAFKLKTTAPKKFAVRPSSGIVEPGTTKEVHVSLSFFFF